MPNICSSTISRRANDTPHPPKKSITLHHVAILVPYDELVMKIYTHIQLAIVKNQDYWLLTSTVGIKIQKALNCSTQLKTTGLFSHILGTSSLQNITKNTIIWCTQSNSIS
jgi:hypothetical protein